MANRLAAGYGFQRATTNSQENVNMQLKTWIDKEKLPLHRLIKELQKFVSKELEKAAAAIICDDNLILKDRTNFLGYDRWSMLNIDEKKGALFTAIGLTDTDVIPGLLPAPDTFPEAIAPNTSEKYRADLVKEAKQFTVHDNHDGHFIVSLGDDTKKLYVKAMPITCRCKFANNKHNICVHVLAIHFKHPEMNILNKLEAFFMAEKPTARIKRNFVSSDGAKGSINTISLLISKNS